MSRQPECESLSDAQLIELIAEDVDYLKCVSHKTREYCMRFMQRLSNDSVDVAQLKDIYHDALIVLYEKAKDGQFVLSSSIQTYLNSICRYQLLNIIKSSGRISSLSIDAGMGDDSTEITGWLPIDDNAINNERIQAIVNSLETMKGRGDCYELLQLVHYHNRTMKDVAEHFGYKNEQIARNKNYLCREKLRTLTLQALKKLNL